MRPDYYILQDILDKNEIDFITKEGMKNLEKATTMSAKVFSRRNKVSWFHKDENKDLDKILNRIVDVLFNVSKDFYNQKLNNLY